jgi:hypothetical protein
MTKRDMKWQYDIPKRISWLDGPIGIESDLAEPIERAESKRSLRNWSEEFITCALHCILVGRRIGAIALLNKAREWIERAVEQNEARTVAGIYFQYQTCALAHWLADNIHDDKSLAICIEQQQRLFQANPEDLRTIEFHWAAVTFLNAGAHEQLLELAARSGTIDINNLRLSAANEKTMALALADQASHQRFDPAKVEKTTKKFLDGHVGRWFKDGQATRVAEWLKVIYWQRGESGLTPEEVIMKALNHMEIL